MYHYQLPSLQSPNDPDMSVVNKYPLSVSLWHSSTAAQTITYPQWPYSYSIKTDSAITEYYHLQKRDALECNSCICQTANWVYTALSIFDKCIYIAEVLKPYMLAY